MITHTKLERQVKLIITTDLLEEPFTTDGACWRGIMDLSALGPYTDNYYMDNYEEYYIQMGMYPWYGTCGNIISVKEVEW